MPAAEQKKCFEALLTTALGDECNLDVVQTVHDQLCQRIELHKEAKVPEPLMIAKADVKEALASCGVSEEHLAKFSVDYDETFGFEADLHPKNIIDSKRFEIKTPDVSIKVDPTRSDLIETRVIGGVKYIMICADENVEVNGVSIHRRAGACQGIKAHAKGPGNCPGLSVCAETLLGLHQKAVKKASEEYRSDPGRPG